MDLPEIISSDEERKKPITEVRQSLEQSKDVSKGVSTRIPFSEENRFDLKFTNRTDDFESELYKPQEEKVFVRPAIVPPLDLGPIIRKREAHVYTTSFSDTNSSSAQVNNNLEKIEEEGSKEKSEDINTFTSKESENKVEEQNPKIVVKEDSDSLIKGSKRSQELPKLVVKSARLSKKSQKNQLLLLKKKLKVGVKKNWKNLMIMG